MIGTRDKEMLSIGRLSKAVGIPVETLRIWERRYGNPQPTRLPSGHRRFYPDQVRQLRRVRDALALGHRPGQILRLEPQELTHLLEQETTPDRPDSSEQVLVAVRGFEAEELRNQLRRAWSREGTLPFLSRFLDPVLVMVGHEWAEGGLDVRHEHFLTEIVEDFLRATRADLHADAHGPALLLSTPPGELHGLGVQMAAVVATLAGLRPRILGTDTPLEDIVMSVAEARAVGVALSVSVASGGVETDQFVARLRGKLPLSIPIFLGGRGARRVRRSPRGVAYLPDWETALAEFEQLNVALGGNGAANGQNGSGVWQR